MTLGAGGRDYLSFTLATWAGDDIDEEASLATHFASAVAIGATDA
jgi:hypothetical protein